MKEILTLIFIISYLNTFSQNINIENISSPRVSGAYYKDINNLLGQCCFVEGGYRNKRAKVPFDEILKLDAKHVLITTACLASFINRLDKSIETESVTDEVAQKKESEIQLLGRLKDALGESFFIELQNHDTDKQK